MKRCTKCKEEKELTEFHKCKSHLDGLAYWCKLCVKANGRKHHIINRVKPEYVRDRKNTWIKNRHGISLQQYEDMLVAQGSKCAICDIALLRSGSWTHLDHCHKTGKLRAFLCTNCNRGLGHFQDNPNLLEKAVDYLNTHNTNEKV